MWCGNMLSISMLLYWKKYLEKAGIDSQHYKSHSFIIGISTSASLLGISNDDIVW